MLQGKLLVYHYKEACRLPFFSRRAQLKRPQEAEALSALSRPRSRNDPAGRVQRASILLRYRAGDTTQALADLPGRGSCRR
jgi:hypothetical protein